ncbi:MAG: hypothetical protein ACI81R_001657 [Bradymonadia bacterium]|jgi:hypothetical protein
MHTFARSDAEAIEKTSVLVSELLDRPPLSVNAREAEDAWWVVVLEVARLLLGAPLGMACRAAAEKTIARRKLGVFCRSDRLGPSCWAKWTTTVWRVLFPFFAIGLAIGLAVVLDAYHVLERFGELVTALHRRAKNLHGKLHAALAPLVAGIRNDRPRAVLSIS